MKKLQYFHLTLNEFSMDVRVCTMFSWAIRNSVVNLNKNVSEESNASSFSLSLPFPATHAQRNSFATSDRAVNLSAPLA
jgi:hypothetical protein